MEFAICNWVPDLSDTALDALEAEGVTAMEPGPAFLRDRDGDALKTDAERLRARGIRLYSCHAPFWGDNDLSSLDEDKRSTALANHVACLRETALVGAECLVVHPSGPAPSEEHGDRLQHLRASLEALVAHAEETGVRLALENMLPGHLGCDTAVVRQVVDDIDSPFLGVCFDTGHAHLNDKGVMGAFADLRERIINFHLQDNDGQGDKHLQPPYGTIDWDALGAAVRAMDFAHPIAIEAPPWKTASWGLLLREVSALMHGERLITSMEGRDVRAICNQCGRYCFGTPRDWWCGCDESRGE